MVVLLAVSIFFLLALLSLSLDAGRAYIAQAHVQQAVDAAAVTGAQYLPEDPAEAESQAITVAEENGLPGTAVTLAITDDGQELDVQGQASVPLFFARLFGVDSATVSALAGARVGSVEEMTGLVPLAVQEGDYAPGQVLAISWGGAGREDGNCGAVQLGPDPGANAYENNLLDGYQAPVALGDTLMTETGDMVGPTDDGLNARLAAAAGDTNPTPANPRLLFVPVVTPFGNGKSTVTVVGFAAFWLESVSDGVVTGEFLQEVLPGEAGSMLSDTYGLKAVQLVR